ncbi:MAG: hypothetical protein KFH87_00735 [Bacteroidetes bacterium]|nr:hypothetical protein [Bacteroidota bacterium]
MNAFLLLHVLLLFVLYSLPATSVHAQCTCMGGAAVGGAAAGYGSAAMGVLSGQTLRAGLAYSYGYGDSYLRGSDAAETGPVEYYRMHYSDLSLAYGVSDALTIEAGLGMFPRKLQHFPDYTIVGSGFSHLLLGGRFLLLDRVASPVEWTIGGNIRIPLSQPSAYLPQHLNPSTGAFSIGMHTRLAKSVFKDELFLLLYQSVDFNSNNAAEYRYGPGLLSSVTGLWKLSDHLMLLTEIRHDYRMSDVLYGERIYDSGSRTLVLSPQIGIRAGQLTFLPFLDYPLYRNYNGHQLANDFTTGLTVIWQGADNETIYTP